MDGFGGGGDLIDHTSVEIDPESRVGRLDVDEINRISLLVRGFLEDTCPQFVAQAEANFMRVRYFPISALGTSPEFDEGATKFLKVRSSKLQPFRVTHPLLWLMHRSNLIPRMPPDPGTQYASAKVLSAQGGLRVQMPKSRLVLNLDSEYVGTWIIDPHSGERVSIPSVELTIAQPRQAPEERPSSSAPQAPNDSHTLRLPDPPQPKRGWFTRK